MGKAVKLWLKTFGFLGGAVLAVGGMIIGCIYALEYLAIYLGGFGIVLWVAVILAAIISTAFVMHEVQSKPQDFT